MINGNEEGTEEGINILIKRAYIENLEVDLIEWVKRGWNDFIDFIGTAWDALFGVAPTAKVITDEEGEGLE